MDKTANEVLKGMSKAKRGGKPSMAVGILDAPIPLNPTFRDVVDSAQLAENIADRAGETLRRFLGVPANWPRGQSCTLELAESVEAAWKTLRADKAFIELRKSNPKVEGAIRTRMANAVREWLGYAAPKGGAITLVPKAEPAKVETAPKAEPAKVETAPKAEPAKVETAPKAEAPTTTELKAEPAKVVTFTAKAQPVPYVEQPLTAENRASDLLALQRVAFLASTLLPEDQYEIFEVLIEGMIDERRHR